MDRTRFVVGHTPLEIENIKNQAILDTFKDFYVDYFLNGSLKWSGFWTAKDSFFDEVDAKNIPLTAPQGTECKAAYHDGFFNNFTIAWKK